MLVAALVCALVMTATAVAAPGALLRIAPWRFPKLRMVRYALLVGTLAFLLVVFTHLVCVGVGAEATWTPIAVASAVTLSVVAVSLRSLTPFRRVHALARSLTVDPTRAEARRELLSLVRGAQPADARAYRVHASLVLTVVGALAEARLWDDAAALLATLDLDRLTPALRATHAISLANCRAYLGEHEAARALLEALERPLSFRPLEEAAATSDALLLALTGEPREALARVEALGVTTEPKLSRAHEITRAHAYEALGETESARAALHRLREAHGEDGLLRVQASNGPASALATALLTSRDTPYRG